MKQEGRGRLVVFDLETSGLDPERDQILQIGAVALSDTLEELGSFEVKARLEGERASGGEGSGWGEVSEREALRRFGAFLKEHATLRRETARGKPYFVAELSGYNTAFDVPFVKERFEQAGEFFPGAFLSRCVLQRALWHFFETGLPAPLDWKLGTLSEAFGVELGENAHDALHDAKATADLYRAMLSVRAPKRAPLSSRARRKRGERVRVRRFGKKSAPGTRRAWRRTPRC